MVRYAPISALHGCFPFHTSAGFSCSLTINIQLMRNVLGVLLLCFQRQSVSPYCLFIFPTHTKCRSLSRCGLRWRSSGWIQWGCTRPGIRFLARLRMNMSCYLWLSDRKICFCQVHRLPVINRPSSLGLYLVAMEICHVQLCPTNACKPCFPPSN